MKNRSSVARILKRLHKSVAVMMIACTLLIISVVFAGATQSKTQNFNKNYTLTGNQVNDIVNIAIAQIGKKGSSFDYTEHWCADFVSDCARLAGVPSSVITYTGGVSNMYSGMMSSGATVVSSPKKGDLVFYKNQNGWCHVALMIDSSYSIHGNVNGNAKDNYTFLRTSYVTKCTYGAYNNGSPTFVRPKYSGSSTNLNWKDTATRVDLGDNFYAAIYNTKRNKVLAVENNDNVAMYSYTGAANQVWHFKKNSDGFYTITNCGNKKALDVYNGKTSGLANVWTYESNNTAAQKWGFYSSGSDMFVSATCNPGVLDVANAKYDDGTNININTKTGNNAQLFSIKKLASAGSPILNVSVGNKTKFSWNSVQGATSYILNIYKNSTAGGTAYISKNYTGTSCELELASGTYSAVLYAKNAYSQGKSTVKVFTVTGASSGDGWIYANSLPSSVTSKNYVIQYCPTYTKVAKTSPGSGWVKGAVAKQEYENSGSVYYSTLPLKTSDTRVLVNYSYYHWCSGSKGDEVNYESTSVFGHYDGIDKSKVTEFYSHADYSDGRYTFYGLKYKDTGNYAYCKSGVTCDGSYGSHGNRSYYWYKIYYYQDKAPVNYYYFTKQGGWSSSKDSSASSHTVRYRKKCSDSHKYKITSTTKATLSKNGKTVSKCSVCSNTKTTTVYYPKIISFSKTSYVYNGKTQTPSVTVKDYKGNKLKKDTDYSVKYESGRKSAGKYTVTITFKGKYSGTKKLTYTIVPKATGKITASQTTTTITLKWNKVTGADGYRVYKYNSKTKKYEKLKDVTSTSLKLSKLKAGTAYKYKVRAYTKDDGTIWGVYSGAFEAATKCNTPSITKLTTSKGKASFVWSNVAGESGYQVYCSSKKDSGYSKAGSYKANITKGSNSKLKSGKKYYFKVRAYKKTASGTVYSSWSAVKSIKIK